MALKRGESLSRGSRYTKIQNQFGVVRTATPDIGSAITSFTDTFDKITLQQARIMDEEWKSSFNVGLDRFITEETNKELQSENPDFQKLQNKITSYKATMLSKAPKRFFNYIENKVDQVAINSLDKVVQQSNAIKEARLAESLNEDYSSILRLAFDYKEQADSLDYRQIGFDTMSRSQYIDMKFGTLTNNISEISTKYQVLKELDPLKYSDATEKQFFDKLWFDLETVRLNGKADAIYANVDFTNAESILTADAEASNFLDQYEGDSSLRLSKFFEPEDIEKLTNTVVNRIKTIKNRNDLEVAKSTRKKFAEDYINYENLTKDIAGILIEPTQGANIFTNADNEPYGLDDWRKFFEDKDIKVTEKEISDIQSKNISAINIREAINQSLKNTDLSLIDSLNNPRYETDLDNLNLKPKEIVQDYIASLAPNLEDSLEGYLQIDQVTANQIYPMMRENGVLTKGAEQLFNSINQRVIRNSIDKNDIEFLNEWADKTLPIWRALSEDGALQFDGIDKGSKEIYSFFSLFPDSKTPMSLFEGYLNMKDQQGSKQEYFKANGEMPSFPAFDMVYDRITGEDGYNVVKQVLEKEYQKEYKKNLIGGGHVNSVTNIAASKTAQDYIEDTYAPDYLENMNDMIMSQARNETLLVVDDSMTAEQIEAAFQETTRDVINRLVKEEEYGTTQFAPFSGKKKAFVKGAMEKVHGLTDPYDATNKLVSFVRMGFEEMYQPDSPMVNFLQDQGIESPPTTEDIYHMAEDGVFELHRVEGTDDYIVKLNLDNSRKYSAYSLADEVVEIKVSGQNFNPTRMFDTTFSTFATEKINEKLDALGEESLIMRPISHKVFGILQMGDVPFDDSEFNMLQVEFQDMLIDTYEEVANDYAFQFSNRIRAVPKDPNEPIEQYLNRMAMDIHRVVFEEAADYTNVGNIQDSVNTVINEFSDMVEFKPGQAALLVDLVNTYNPDISKLKSAIKSGKAERIFEVFPEMGSYQKRILAYSFSEEYYETN